MTRQAISPRLAIRIFSNTVTRFLCVSKGDVAVLAPRFLDLLVAQHQQGAANPLAGLVRLDDIVYVASGTGDEWVCKFRLVLGFACHQFRRVALLLTENNLYRALCAHD